MGQSGEGRREVVNGVKLDGHDEHAVSVFCQLNESGSSLFSGGVFVNVVDGSIDSFNDSCVSSRVRFEIVFFLVSGCDGVDQELLVIR